MRLLDTTLREGDQSAGILFSVLEKIEWVKQISAFGISFIEIGHPGISLLEEENCREIVKSAQNVEFLVHARALERDIIAAKNTGASWVGIWIAYNDIALATKFREKSREWIQNQVKESILLAKRFGLKVRFTIEDASRTDWSLIHELGMIAVNAGVNCISLADTVGLWHPKECEMMVKNAVAHFGCEIEVHLHNDLGLAHANAISAIDAGASIIDVSMLGIGERAGICDLLTLSLLLEKFYGEKEEDNKHNNHYRFELSQNLAQFIARIGAFEIEPHRPIVGRNAFTHVSSYHIKAMNRKPKAYESLNPKFFGAQRKLSSKILKRESQQRFLNTLQIKKPFPKAASELLYHRDGVGTRWVFMDSRIDERSPVYIIERTFEKEYRQEEGAYVDAHAHHCDSIFVFMGNQPDGSGLKVSVTFGDDKEHSTTKIFDSPASVFIPAHVYHTYAYISGTGRFLNFVLSPNYNESLDFF